MSDPNGAASSEPTDFDAIFDKAVAEQESASADTAASSAPDEGAAPATEAPSQPRDESGKFVARTESAPQADSAPADQPPSEAQPPATETASEAVYPQFQYRASGRDYELPGSKVGADGLFVPTDQLPYLQRLLAEGHQNRDLSRDFGRKVADARRDGELKLQQANNLLAELADIARDPNRMADWGLDLERNWDLLRARAEKTVMEQQLAAERARLTEYEEEQQAAALVPQLESALGQTISSLLGRPEFQGVDGPKMYDRLMHNFFDRIFAEATPEDVAAGIARNVGDIVIDYGVIEDEMKYEADVLHRAQTAQRAAVEAAGRNAKAQTQQRAVPPTVGAKAGPAPKAAPALPKFTTTRDVDEWFDKGGYDDIG